jgi:hypothetical protein
VVAVFTAVPIASDDGHNPAVTWILPGEDPDDL